MNATEKLKNGTKGTFKTNGFPKFIVKAPTMSRAAISILYATLFPDLSISKDSVLISVSSISTLIVPFSILLNAFVVWEQQP